MRKVILKWSKLSVLLKIQKARLVVSNMTTNVLVFPNPDPALQDIADKADELELAEDAASYGGTDRTIIRDGREKELGVMMDDQILYVETVTKGDKEMTALAGMETQKVPERWPKPEKPVNFRTKQGEFEGSVYMICKPVKYNHQYTFQMFFEAEDGKGGEWRDIKTQGRYSFTHVGLVRGKLYRFRAFAFNAAGDGPVSDESVSAAT